MRILQLIDSLEAGGTHGGQLCDASLNKLIFRISRWGRKEGPLHKSD
jgi:hypothetical protein